MAWGYGWGDTGGSIYGRRQGTGVPYDFWGTPPPDSTAAPPKPVSSTGPPPGAPPPVTGASQALYQYNPQLVWAKLLGLEAPNADSHYARWLGNQYDLVKAQADLASIGNPNAQYTQQFAAALPGLAQRYLALPGWQQGKSAPVASAGRYLNL
jgi:hypothetical protein